MWIVSQKNYCQGGKKNHSYCGESDQTKAKSIAGEISCIHQMTRGHQMNKVMPMDIRQGVMNVRWGGGGRRTPYKIIPSIGVRLSCKYIIGLFTIHLEPSAVSLWSRRNPSLLIWPWGCHSCFGVSHPQSLPSAKSPSSNQAWSTCQSPVWVPLSQQLPYPSNYMRGSCHDTQHLAQSVVMDWIACLLIFARLPL